MELFNTHTVGSHPQSKELSFTLDMNKPARTELFFYIPEHKIQNVLCLVL